jgi:hypothetical protein
MPIKRKSTKFKFTNMVQPVNYFEMKEEGNKKEQETMSKKESTAYSRMNYNRVYHEPLIPNEEQLGKTNILGVENMIGTTRYTPVNEKLVQQKENQDLWTSIKM